MKLLAAVKGQAVVNHYVRIWHACVGRVLAMEGCGGSNVSASQRVDWRKMVRYQKPHVRPQGHISTLLRFPLSSLLPSTTPRTRYPLFRTHNIHSPTHRHCHSIVTPTQSASRTWSRTGGVPQIKSQCGAYSLLFSTPSLDYHHWQIVNY